MSPSILAALEYAARALGVPSSWLWAVIQQESRWDPAARNPRSSARGLLQWIDSTARGLGYRDSADLVRWNATAEDQLRGPVLSLLLDGGPYRTLDDLALAVFYPSARRDPDAPLPAAVQAANPGIVTGRDHANLVRRWVSAAPSTGGDAPSGTISPAVLVAVFLLLVVVVLR